VIRVSRLPQRTRLLAALLLAAALAGAWWLVARRFESTTGVPVWADQRATFTQTLHHLADPYPALAFPYVPWTAALLAPLGLLPFRWAVLIQLVLYFVLLAALIIRFGGGVGTVLLVLTSAIAFDTALEINIEWLVCLGLLLPRAWSGPLLLIKPQVALGYGLSFRRREMVWGGVVVLAVAAVSLLLWPGWPGKMLGAVRANTLGSWGARINIAPSVLLPWPLSWTVGLLLGWRAFRRRDAILGVLAWQCFVPYATLYGILPAFALFAVRWPGMALVVSLTLWALYVGVVLPFVAG
jgi:hypothetical protein